MCQLSMHTGSNWETGISLLNIHHFSVLGTFKLLSFIQIEKFACHCRECECIRAGCVCPDAHMEIREQHLGVGFSPSTLLGCGSLAALLQSYLKLAGLSFGQLSCLRFPSNWRDAGFRDVHYCVLIFMWVPGHQVSMASTSSC